ncbi:Fur family transcriptional regulator [Cohaesibacter celericrescens]|uniref:Transcriptional repressor n=1 Tax=Cohaesibacter celericrescens TaxID=2067669 RepID=A0A2N5XU46_9HYPH|nr:Fur family transcriptional regulator [Cohaesibacter celericrescens]PLW78024.1 transcriptional repressor [Cohaesibacter celericrescens]
MIELESHDHSHCIDQVLGAAEAVCKEKGLRLTDQRKSVLKILAASHVPASAYDILDRLNSARKEHAEAMLAPVSIYRALDFLLQNGMIHRIESRNAYVACSHTMSPHSEITIFMLCDQCGRAGEFQSESLGGLIERIAATAQFLPHAPVMEIRGICAECRQIKTESS